jgi:transmembrane sensor
LLQGEALFTVAKDKARPFIVHNHGRNVQALGTIFNVRESKTEMQVSVLEGVVEVSMAPNTTPNAAPNTAKDIKQSSVATLVAGQALELDSLGQFSPTYTIEVNERMAWQDGRLNYVNTELANVIFDLKRYSTLSIHIPDKQVANMGYTGSVIYDKVDDWLTALPYIFPVEVQRHGDSIVIVKREG